MKSHVLVVSFAMAIALHAYAQPAGPITLRGVPLGKPGVAADLKKMCRVPDSYPVGRADAFCNFRSSFILVPEFEYGTFLGSATFSMGQRGSLEVFEIRGKASDVPRLIEQLRDRYGPGERVTVAEYKDGKTAGRRQETRWKDRAGNRITVAQNGVVRLEAASVAQFSERIEHILEKGWDKSDGRL